MEGKHRTNELEKIDNLDVARGEGRKNMSGPEEQTTAKTAISQKPFGNDEIP